MKALLGALFSALFLCLAAAPLQAGDNKSEPEEMVGVVLSSDIHSGNTWRYTIDKKASQGQVEQVPFRQYEAWQEKKAQAATLADPSNMIHVFDEPAPGTTLFTFKGVKEGLVELNFTYASEDNPEASPEYMATVKIQVYADKKLVVTETREFPGPAQK